MDSQTEWEFFTWSLPIWIRRSLHFYD